MKRKFRLISLLSAGLASLALAATGQAREAASDGMGVPPAPPVPAINRLELQPATLTLTDGRDARQVLVWGVTADGQRFDLSESAKLQDPASCP